MNDGAAQALRIALRSKSRSMSENTPPKHGSEHRYRLYERGAMQDITNGPTPAPAAQLMTTARRNRKLFVKYGLQWVRTCHSSP